MNDFKYFLSEFEKLIYLAEIINIKNKDTNLVALNTLKTAYQEFICEYDDVYNKGRSDDFSNVLRKNLKR